MATNAIYVSDMISALRIAVICLLLSTFVVAAGPREDARFLFDSYYPNGANLDGLDALHARTFDNLNEGLKVFDAEIIDQDAFMGSLFDGFPEYVASQIRTAAIESYVSAFSPTELAWLAVYFGKPAEETLPLRLEDLDIQQMEEKLPDLSDLIEEALREGLSDLPRYFDIQRIADLMENPDVIAFKDEQTRRDAVAGIRTLK